MTRAELYDRVWEIPMIRLAKEFGLSDQGLAKICKRHHIPKPGPGYWSKLEHGKAPPRPGLPSLDDTQLDKVRISSPTLSQKRKNQESDTGKNHSDIAQLAETFTPPKKIQRYPDIVADYRSSVKDKYTNRYGFLEIRGERFRDIEIRLTSNSYKRGCSLLHMLDKFFKHLGWEMKQNADNGYKGKGLIVINDTDILMLKLKERVKQVKHEPTKQELADAKRWNRPVYVKYDYEPTGNIELSVENLHYVKGFKRKWIDRPNSRLESMLPEIAVGFARAFEYRKTDRLESERRAEQWRIEEERRSELRRQRKVEDARRQHLFDLCKSYSKAQELRHMIAIIEEGFTGSKSCNEWANWAKDFADQLDPTLYPEAIISEYISIEMESIKNLPHGGF